MFQMSKSHLQKPSGRVEEGTPESQKNDQCGGACGRGAAWCQVSGQCTDFVLLLSRQKKNKEIRSKS